MKKKGFRWAHDVSEFYRGEPIDQFAGGINKIAHIQSDAIHEISKESEVLIANLTIADRLSHFVWSEIDSEQDLGREPYIVQAYEFLDESLAKLEEQVGDSGVMMVFTEIGFGHLDEFVSINNFLLEAGLLKLNRDGSIDDSNSVAKEAVQGSHGINLLRKKGSGQKRGGYEKDLEQVCRALSDFRFPDGSPVIATAQPREEIYHGPHVNLAPDIIIIPADPNRPPLGDPFWADHVNRHYQTGWHRDEGFCILLGATKKPNPDQMITLESIAPTIARVMDRDIPHDCEGESLVF